MISGQPQDYESESDARSLATAHEVRRDKKRHGKAMKQLKKMSKSNSHHEDTHAHEKQAYAMVHGTEGDTTNAGGMA